jgi:hypothetical protein
VPKKTEVKKESKVKILKPPVVFNKTQKYLGQLSEVLGCPVLSYFKPASGNIWSQDLYAFVECLKSYGKIDTLALYIRSNGGQGMVSLRIVNLLRSFTNKLILLAPSECASAATMLALGCDEIYMGPLSSLSPVDSSLTHQLSPLDKLNSSVPVSLDELWRVLRLWKEAESNEFGPNAKVKEGLETATEKLLDTEKAGPENPYKYLYEYIHPLVFGAVDRYSSLSVRICKEILSYHMKDQALIDSITKHLNYDYPAHGYPITIREAEKIGLPVKDLTPKMQDILNNLQLLYSELTEEKITDYDNSMYHDHSIYSVVETTGQQLVYQQDYDKFYREAEKRYITINDLSGWYKTSSSKTDSEKSKTERIFLN